MDKEFMSVLPNTKD